MQIPRKVARVGIALGAVAAIGGVAWLGDSAAAMHAEHHLSQAVKESARLETSPRVYIGGMPYLGALMSKEVPLIEVNAMDVEVPQIGLVNASTTLRDVTVTPDQVWSGDFTGAQVSTFSRSISLDGVALGRLLDMTDLSIANSKNISPSGGKASEAELTGTIPSLRDSSNGDTKATVIVTLRLVGPMFHMKVAEVTDLPEGASEEAVRKAFTYELDTRNLPLPAQATAVTLMGGSISFETQRFNTELRNAQLSPIEIDGQFDAEGNDTGSGNEPPPAPAE